MELVVRRKTMKNSAIIFSFLLVLILLGANFVSAADMGNQDSLLLENEDLGLSQGYDIDFSNENENLRSSQGYDIDLRYDNEILGNDNQENLGETDISYDYEILGNDNQENLGETDIGNSHDESANELGSTADELFLNEIDAIPEMDMADVITVTGQSNDLDVLAADTSTYSELSREIGYGGDIELQHAYYTYDYGNSIVIQNAGVIDGKGAIIDMDGSNIRTFIANANVTFKNLTIKNARYDVGSGSALYFNVYGTVENCNFTANHATDGGAIFFINEGIITDCAFVNNSAINDAGAVNFENLGAATGCTFVNNSAISDGGALNFDRAAGGTVTNCNFEGNSASYRGGAIFFFDEAIVTDCTFADNSAYFGGAIAFEKVGTATGSTFVNNSALSSGGAIYFGEDSSSSTMANCDFTFNNAFAGSALYFIRSSATISVSNSLFLNNRQMHTL